jgi:predicted CopG family antitoxin
MPTKTISLEDDAYQMLKRQKRRKNESFSDVVRRLADERDPVEYLEELAANPPKVDVKLLRRRQALKPRSNRPARQKHHAV